MLNYLCAVRDRQLNAFMRPFAAQSLGQAIRSFRDITNDPQSDIHKHPEDYELYHVGTFDDDNGKLSQVGDLPKQIAIATNLVERS